MSKSLYTCIIEGDPICTKAPEAQRLLLIARDSLKDLAFLLAEIDSREGEQETHLGYLEGCVDSCLQILESHTRELR